MTRKRKNEEINAVDNDPSSSIDFKLAYSQIKAIVKSDNSEKLRELIESGRIVSDTVNRRKIRDLLIDACEKGSLACVKILLEYNTDSNRDFNLEVLRSACRSGSRDLLHFLIEKGLPISDEILLRTLRSVGIMNNTAFSSILVARLIDINYRSAAADDVLYFASEAGNIEIVRILLERGANQLGLALVGAAAKRRIEVVKLLLRAQGERISMERLKIALQSAVHRGCIDIVRSIVEYGVDEKALNGALRESISRSKTDMAEYLLDSGAHINAAPDNAHSNLYLACAQGSSDMVALLLARGADPNAVDGRGERPLGAALSYPEIVQLMLQGGTSPNQILLKADPDQYIADGKTALLELAISRCDNACSALAILLRHNADPNLARSDTGETPLMAAAVAERTDRVQLLLEYKADVTQLNQAGRSVLDILGNAWQYRNIVKLCKEYIHINRPEAKHIVK